ncbi:Rv3654c family TadE-like protein [Kitasatospora sp. NPDC051853]|uniref:Rv3654c family TadE-like protein n=1 Tax=Kitasatospora sp. NPDC051853 TaxID=3364058 RepID=UPI003797944E
MPPDGGEHPAVNGWRGAGGSGGSRRAADRGSATIWLVSLAMIGCVVFAATLAVGTVVAARHRAESAADLAALAAAGHLMVDEDGGCGRAARIAGEHRARLVSCEVRESIDAVDVVVEVRISGVPFPVGPARARSRAGPVWAWGNDAVGSTAVAPLPATPAPGPGPAPARAVAPVRARTSAPACAPAPPRLLSAPAPQALQLSPPAAP